MRGMERAREAKIRVEASLAFARGTMRIISALAWLIAALLLLATAGPHLIKTLTLLEHLKRLVTLAAPVSPVQALLSSGCCTMLALVATGKARTLNRVASEFLAIPINEIIATFVRQADTDERLNRIQAARRAAAINIAVDKLMAAIGCWLAKVGNGSESRKEDAVNLREEIFEILKRMQRASQPNVS